MPSTLLFLVQILTGLFLMIYTRLRPVAYTNMLQDFEQCAMGQFCARHPRLGADLW